MSKAPRIPDIAREAGVSTATVDRVLNKRPGVRGATVERVLRAAAALDYLPDAADPGAALQGTQARPLRLSFLLPNGSNRFIRMLGDMVSTSREHWASLQVRCRTEFIESFNPLELAAALRRHGAQSDGVAVMPLDHPAVREAVNELAASGVHVVTLISDLPNSPRSAYLGLDNRAAGRTAGYLVGRFIGARSANVALIAGSRSYSAHVEREAGFHSVMDELFPRLTVVGLREGQDDAELNYRQMRALLEQYPQLAGIYNIGGAADGVARALKEVGRNGATAFVGHGLTPDTRALLIDGTLDAVITQNPQATVLSCARIFMNLRERREPLLGVETTRSQVIFRENLP